MGYTLNRITMLALTLMVGVVIDDAIIVLENIYRYMEEKQMNPFMAAIEGGDGDILDRRNAIVITIVP